MLAACSGSLRGLQNTHSRLVTGLTAKIEMRGDAKVASLATLLSLWRCCLSVRSSRDALDSLRWCAGRLSLCESSGFEPRSQHNVRFSVLLWRCWDCYPCDSSPF